MGLRRECEFWISEMLRLNVANDNACYLVFFGIVMLFLLTVAYIVENNN
jgi:hypothetical protein